VKTFGCFRLVYNLALEIKIAANRSFRVSLSLFDLYFQLTELMEVSPWLIEEYSQALQASVKN